MTVHQIEEVHQKLVNTGFTKDHIVTMPRYAEIHVFEPYLTPDGHMEWRPVTELCFDRDFLGTIQPQVKRTMTPLQPRVREERQDDKGAGTGFSVTPTAGTAAPATAPTQVNVNCGPGAPCAAPCPPAARKGPVVRLWDACKPKRATVGTSVSDVELTPDQLAALVNSRLPGGAGLLPPPTPGAPQTPPPVVAGTLPPGLPVFGGPPPRPPQ